MLHGEAFFLVLGLVVALLAFDAQGHHGDGAEYGHDGDGHGGAHAHAFADQQGQHHTVDQHARTGEYPVDGQQRITLLQIVGHGVEHGVGRHIRQGVYRVPCDISHAEPDQLAQFAHAGRDGKQDNGDHRDQAGGDSQPRQAFQSVFEFYFVKNVAKNGVVDRVPDLDHQQHDGHFRKIDALHGKIGGDKGGGDVVVNVLTHEVGPVADPLAKGGHILGFRFTHKGSLQCFLCCNRTIFLTYCQQIMGKINCCLVW